ncbi:MAG: DNA polymerase III subunit beta [Pseudomonadales bacterium]|nr:DNA polymerase III subunit beta [Pseudomonadales bacterium]
MQFTTTREALLKPLQLVTGVVERRQTLPILSNLLVEVSDSGISLTGTDLEVELVAHVNEGIDVGSSGKATIPARKLFDIWRSLPDGAEVNIKCEGDRAIVRSGRSRFSLATLPAGEFPGVDATAGDVELSITAADLRRLIEQTSFAMAHQDVRYFLNGMLLEISPGFVRTVATDGHRLAMCTLKNLSEGTGMQAILPRKGVLELSKVISEDDGDIALAISKNHICIRHSEYTLTSKLVDGKFPDYEKVIPRDAGEALCADRNELKSGFNRAAILSNEKYRGVRLILSENQLTIQANNPEQEEAEETLVVEYVGPEVEIGFNVGYLQDVLSVLAAETVKISVSDANSSVLIEAAGAEDSVFVVMPMRL